MTKYNTLENPPKHILKKGDLKHIKDDLEKICHLKGAVAGAVSGGAVAGAGGAVAGAVLGGVGSLIVDDVIDAIEDTFEIEGISKDEIKEFERETKESSLANVKPKRTKKTNKKMVKTKKEDDSWFGDWW
jgi:chorismate synthase